MKLSPTLGVLITYYNEKEMLRECLDSLLNQPSAPDEVWVYDDASAFPASDYITDPRVRVVRGEKNSGPSFGRNELVRHCGCAFIHFHDADDLFKPAWSERVRAAIAPEGVEAVFTEIETLVDGRIGSRQFMNFDLLEKDGDLLRFCIRSTIVPLCGTYRKDLVVSLGGYRTEFWMSEDYDFHLRLALRRPRFACVTEPVAIARLRPDRRSADQVRCLSDAMLSLKKNVDGFPGEYRMDAANAAATMASALYRHGQPEKAADAFAQAVAWGPPTAINRSWHYRLALRWFGLTVAEKLDRLYKRIPSSRVKQFLSAGKP